MDCLIDRTRRALARAGAVTALVVAGGVAANSAVRGALAGLAQEHALRAGIDLGDPVGAGRDRRGERRLVETGRIGVAARQHRHEAEVHREFAVLDAREVEADRLGIGRVDGTDLGEGLALLRPAVGLQQVEGEADVVRRDRPAVREARRRIEAERRKGAGVVGLDRTGDQAVEREGLVLRARHQGLEDHGVQPLGGRAGLEVEGVQAVESAEHAEPQPAALRRVGIGVGELPEVRRERRGAVHRDGGGLRLRRLRARVRRGRHQRGRQEQGHEAAGAGRGAGRCGHLDPRPSVRCWCRCDHPPCKRPRVHRQGARFGGRSGRPTSCRRILTRSGRGSAGVRQA